MKIILSNCEHQNLEGFNLKIFHVFRISACIHKFTMRPFRYTRGKLHSRRYDKLRARR